MSMIGCVGEDYYGKVILENFKLNGVFVKNVKLVIDLDSGIVYIIFVEGDNSIVVVKGVNDYIISDYVEKVKEKIKDVDIVFI